MLLGGGARGWTIRCLSTHEGRAAGRGGGGENGEDSELHAVAVVERERERERERGVSSDRDLLRFVVVKRAETRWEVGKLGR